MSSRTTALQAMGVAPRLRRLVVVVAALVMAITATAFIGGWVAGERSLRNLVPGTVEMKDWTALALFACAASLPLHLWGGLRARLAGRLLAGAAVLLGLLVGGQYLFEVDLGIDELLFADETGRRMGIAYPGRFAPTTAAAFVLTGSALLALDVRPWRGWRLAEVLVIPVALIAALSVVGYLYSIEELYGPASAAKMALNTAVCFLALAAGVLLARPRGRLVHLALTEDPGGVLVRRLLPLVVAAPLLLGWAHIQIVEADLLGLRAGAWWLTAVTVVGFGLLVVRLAARLSRAAAERESLEAELIRLANEDALTGLWNRRRFDEELGLQVLRCRRYGETAALLMLDLDHFKQINDRFGHHVGDDLIRHVGTTLRDRLRGSDCLARLGGDEFGILLPSITPDQAATTAELLRGWLADHPFRHDMGPIALSVSVGVAFLDANTADPAQAMVAADVAMYDAKADGRDQVSGLRHPRSDGPVMRVVHCDDSEAYRRLLAEMLRAHSDIEVVAGCPALEGLDEAVAHGRPDVVLLDAGMAGDVTGAVERVRTVVPHARVLLLSGLSEPPAHLADLLDGFVPKAWTFDEIADSVRAVTRQPA